MTRKNDIGTLPEWARAKIEQLQADIEYRDRQAQNASESDTDVFIDDYLHEPRGLPRGTGIRFVQNGERIRVAMRGDCVEAYAPEGRILVIPVASNVVQLKVENSADSRERS